MEEPADEICRLCLSKEDLVWVLDGRMNNNVQEIIYTTSGVEILASDIVSQKVCVTCLQITIKMFKFRNTALKNDRDLKEKYKQIEPKKKVATTSAVGTKHSSPTHKKQKITADIDNPPEELPRKQEERKDPTQNVIASKQEQKKDQSENLIAAKQEKNKDQPQNVIASRQEKKNDQPQNVIASRQEKKNDQPQNVIASRQEKKNDQPQNVIASRQEKKNDQPQNVIAAKQENKTHQSQNNIAAVVATPPQPQPQLRKIHPSVIKMMRDNPDYKFPKMPMNEHYLPVITLFTDEVDSWFKNRNYSDIDIERLKQFALNYHSTPVATGSSVGSSRRSSSSSSVASQQQAPAAEAPTKRRKDVTDVKELPDEQKVAEKYQNDNKKIRLSSNIIIRPANSVNTQSQIPSSPLCALLNKPATVSPSNNNKSEDIDGLISELLSKSGQSPTKSSKISPPPRKEVCDTKSTSIKLKLVCGNKSDLSSEAIIGVDSSKNKNDSKHSSASIKDGSDTSSWGFKSRDVGTERDSCSSKPKSRLKKRKKFIIEDSDDDSDVLDNNDAAEIEMQPHFSHQQQQRQQQKTTTQNDAILVGQSKSPLTVARQPEPQQIQTTANASGNVAVPSTTSGMTQKYNFLGAMLDSSDLFSFKCTECPATYDRLLDFNLHVRLHADKKALRQYRHNSTDLQKDGGVAESHCTVAVKSTGEISAVATPSPSPSITSSNGSEALVITSTNDDVPSPSTSTATTNDNAPSTSALLVPKNSGNKLFSCKICDSMHYTRKDLKIHVRRRHCRCQFCAARFKTPEERDEHVNLHCGITRVHRNLKVVKIELTKVDLDDRIKRKYPEAFKLLSENEATALEESLLVVPTSNNDHEDLLVQEDTSTTRATPLSEPQEEVICISDDETSESTAVAEPEPIREPQSPSSANNVFRPKITIAGSNILQGVNIHDDDKNIMRYILTKMVHSQDNALERPTDKDIVEGTSRKTQVLKNLRKQLYKHNIPVEIHHGDKLMVTYKYEQGPAKAACDDNWNLLPPKQLMSYREMMAKKMLETSKVVQPAVPPVVNITNDNGIASHSSSSSTVQAQPVDQFKTIVPVTMNSAAVNNSEVVATGRQTVNMHARTQRTFGPARSRVTATNNTSDNNQQDRVPRIVSTYVIPAPSSPQNLAATGNKNSSASSPQQQNYLILTMNNEGTAELQARTNKADQPPQLPVIHSVRTVNEAHVISSSSSTAPYVPVSLHQNGLMPAPGIIQTGSGRLSNQPTSSSAMVTPQQQITSYNVRTAINNIMQQQYVQRPVVMTQNSLVQTTSQANTNLASTTNGNFVQYTQPDVMATTCQASSFIQPTAVPQQYTFDPSPPVSMVATTTSVLLNPPPPPPYHMTAPAMSSHQSSMPINNGTPLAYSIDNHPPRLTVAQQQTQTTAPVAGISTAMGQTQHPASQIQAIRNRQALLPQNINETYKDPRSILVSQANDMPTLDFQSQFAQSYATNINSGNSNNNNNGSVEQASAPQQSEPPKSGPCFTIRVKNLSELS